MSRIRRAARYIKPETICIGDVLRITVFIRDVEVSTVGTVANRYYGPHTTEYVSAGGITLLELYTFDDRKIRVTLLDRPSERQPELSGMDI